MKIVGENCKFEENSWKKEKLIMNLKKIAHSMSSRVKWEY